jgi:hypothetical protein
MSKEMIRIKAPEGLRICHLIPVATSVLPLFLLPGSADGLVESRVFPIRLEINPALLILSGLIFVFMFCVVH